MTEHPSVLVWIDADERRRLFPDGVPYPTVEPEPGSERELLALGPEVVVAGWSTPHLPDAAVSAFGGSVRYYCYAAGSVRGKVTREQIAAGLRVTNWGDSVSRTVAECALLLVLAGLRRAGEWVRRMDRGEWKEGMPDQASLFGRTVGLHGFGNVARELVRLLGPFGVDVRAFAPGVPSEVLAASGVRPLAGLGELFGESDVVVELEALTPETRGMVGERELSALRPGSVFVNVGRGAVVDEAALLRRAERGDVQIGLDVYASEPLPADHPLRGLPNVLLLPHIAGPTPDRMPDAGAFALANVARWLRGEALRSEVTAEVFDRIT